MLIARLAQMTRRLFGTRPPRLKEIRARARARAKARASTKERNASRIALTRCVVSLLRARLAGSVTIVSSNMIKAK